MLELGATTFWEEFPDDDKPVRDVRPRCSARASATPGPPGPAQLLPEIVCGLRPDPTGGGWSRFEVDPRLGSLAWAGAIVPVPGGEIAVFVTRERITVHIPAAHVLLRDGVAHHGLRHPDVRRSRILSRAAVTLHPSSLTRASDQCFLKTSRLSAQAPSGGGQVVREGRTHDIRTPSSPFGSPGRRAGRSCRRASEALAAAT